MTPEQLDAIEARANAATKEPWQVEERGGNAEVWSDRHLEGTRSSRVRQCVLVGNGRAEESRADAAFAAAARTDIPLLVAEVRRLQKLLGGAWVRFALPSDEPVQFVGVHPTRWGRYDEPTHGFREISEDVINGEAAG